MSIILYQVIDTLKLSGTVSTYVTIQDHTPSTKNPNTAPITQYL